MPSTLFASLNGKTKGKEFVAAQSTKCARRLQSGLGKVQFVYDFAGLVAAELAYGNKFRKILRPKWDFYPSAFRYIQCSQKLFSLLAAQRFQRLHTVRYLPQWTAISFSKFIPFIKFSF